MLRLEKDCMDIKRKAYLDKEVILSLTTYNKRIFDVALTIESLFQQTIKANRIILWLAEDEFMGRDLPVKLTKLIDRGLEIRYCEDLKSYRSEEQCLNSSHVRISYAVFCLKKKIKYNEDYVFKQNTNKRLYQTMT